MQTPSRFFDGSAAADGFTFDARGGNDSLVGSQGDDVLRGGLGADFMDGGMGSDTFDFDHLGEAGDTIAGFEAVPGGDVLDIAELLAFSTGYADGEGGVLSEFVRLETVGPDAHLQIDPDGSSATESWETLATLLGHAGLAASRARRGTRLRSPSLAPCAPRAARRACATSASPTRAGRASRPRRRSRRRR